MTRVLFFGSSTHSLIVLKALLAITTIELVGVVTKIDKPEPNPVALFTKKNKLTLFQTDTFDENFLNIYKNLKPDLVIVVAYGPPYFSTEMINLPKYKIINIHPSPLPKYRGATPAPWQIINGETTGAVTFFQLDELPDHGPIINQIPFSIDKKETSFSLYQKSFDLAAKNLDTVLTAYLKNPQKLTFQDHSQKTYFPKLSRDIAKINWQDDKNKIEKFIRAMYDWPIAWTNVVNQKNQILKMKVFSSEIVNSDLSLLTVQIEGKNQISWKEIAKYYKIVT
jgi:methionyl-tRNA formyltransferase